MSVSLNLLALSEEIILNILEDADCWAILVCMRTCKRVYDIISRSISIRYLLELAANGMQRGLRSSFGRTQCLEMLTAHEAAWRTLSWTGNASVDILVGWGEPVSVSGNVFGFRTNPGMPDQELLLLCAPSKLRSVAGKTWRIQLPHDIQDVCIDSAQDLLICYCGVKSFHVCSLLQGGNHPRAEHIGIFNATNTWRYRIGSMRVCGDNFAVASEQGLYISVWNWKSGEHLSDFTASLQASVFTFLDEYHILFPSSIDDGLYVYDTRAMPPINTRKQKLKGTHCFEITTPQFWSNGTVCNITLESNSLTMGSDTATGLFYTNYREMHVHARALLMWTQAHPAPPNACVTVPWSAWSASAARVVAPRKDDGDVVYMHLPHSRFSGCGMRIISAASVQSDGTAGVSIADYHPARVFRGLKKEAVRHTHASQAEVEAGFRYKRGVVYAGRSYPSVHNGTYSGLRSERLPLSRVRALFSSFSFPTFHFFRQRSPSTHPVLVLYLRWR
ncbi:hypothetical protein BGY98DRAFT_1016644 [Russula aff. rugulosa BPL654]|nr:hypothetical protein BGY98DRAFT_1016644 [Russula aff. rugulosa BPL654]